MLPATRFIRPLSFGYGVEAWEAMLGDQKVVVRRFGQPALDPAMALLPDEFTLLGLSHPGIQRLLISGNDNDDGTIVHIYEFVEGMSLHSMMVDRTLPSMGLSEFRDLLTDGLDALDYLHSRCPMAPLSHGDVAPGNMVSGPGRNGRRHSLTLIDLRALDMTVNRPEPPAGTPPIVVGTLPYMSNEVLQGSPPDSRAEVWSLAVSLLSVAAGGNPWKQADSPISMVRLRNEIPVSTLFEGIPGRLRSDRLLKKLLPMMMDTDAGSRPSAGAALEMLSSG